MIRCVLLLPLLVGLPAPAAAQTDSAYTQRYLSRSTRFAATTWGGDVLATGSGQTAVRLVDGRLQPLDFSTGLQPRLTIGGLHFWGHADFYVTFPLPLPLQSAPDGLDRLRLTHGIETGARVYPWAVRPGRVVPFVGVSFRTLSYSQSASGRDLGQGPARISQFVAPWQLGWTYATQRWLFTASAYYQGTRRLTYWDSPTTNLTVRPSPWSFQLGIMRYLDTDANMRTPDEVAHENRKHALLARNARLGGWFWAVGPSAMLQLSKSPYFQRYRSVVYDNLTGGFSPDVAVGYHFAKLDANLGVSVRAFQDREQAYDVDVRVRRFSTMLEGSKYLFNYLGFAPYVGPTLSYEYLELSDNGATTTERKLALGLIAGWDIRVTRTGTSLLRTNLRWVPNLHLTARGERVAFDHLEFNFIQYVRFIGRTNFYREAGRKRG